MKTPSFLRKAFDTVRGIVNAPSVNRIAGRVAAYGAVSSLAIAAASATNAPPLSLLFALTSVALLGISTTLSARASMFENVQPAAPAVV